ncbi:hypothetical protein [Hyalangium rubrum]|uniref:Lysozyme inhibitor LprI N-terminal domain-containing protein n=1 Tax=Hyalangium rubrum TaxID=3103134 RepID=A0ABU5H5N3_9BACT|nr:hypothetical protein [Hyalangium sp. s54d21]MDY7228645.1 hypothetical protein [Hyalangium sp. s54d21]
MTFLPGHLGAWTAALLLSAGPAKKEQALKQQAERLAQEARALAKTEGCEQQEECAVAGFGNKACGGPREYIAYCSRTTDVPALESKLAALQQAEQSWQREAGVMSNCGLTRKPQPRLVDGVCRIR